MGVAAPVEDLVALAELGDGGCLAGLLTELARGW